MTISRSQMARQLYAGGGITNLVPRQQYGLGSIVKSIKGAVSGAVDAVSDFAKSDIGQIALAVAAPYALGAYVPGFATLGGTGFMGNALRAGIGNLAVQGLTTGRFDLGQAARSGLIQGGIQTGLQRGFAPKDLKTDLVSQDVTTGAQVLESPVVRDPSIDFEGVQYAETAAPTFRESMADIGLQRGITEPTVAATKPITFEEAFGKDASLSTIQKAQSRILPQRKPIEFTSTTQIPKKVSGIPAITDVEAQFRTDFPGVKYAEQFTVPQAEPVKSLAQVFRDESLSLPQKISEGAKNIVGMGGGDETLKQLIDQPNLSNLMTFAKNNPELLIGSTSLISALSVPKQPDESDFDYEERLKFVNDYVEDYGAFAGVDTSGIRGTTDFYERYRERAKVAIGGLPDEMPMGQPRQNAGGITELDYRETGGFVPVGIKEKADDVPAMLSKNEFVFTADAVRNAGNGDVDKGAQKLYNVMKTLENGGTV